MTTLTRRRLDLSVGQRLALGFGAAGVFLAVLVGLSLSWVSRVAALRAQLGEVIAPRAAAIAAVEASVFDSGNAVRTYALTREPRHADDFRRAAGALRGGLDRLSALPQGERSAALLAVLRPRVERYLPAAEALVVLVAGGAPRERILEEEPRLAAARDELLAAVHAYEARQTERTAEVREEIGAAVRRLERGLQVLAPSVIALLALTALLTTRSVRGPALELLAAARALEAEGDAAGLGLAPAPPARRRRDELAELRDAFASMAAALRARGERLGEQNRELQAQRAELAARNAELHARGEERAAQAEELRHALAALRASEARFRRSVANAPFPIMIHGEDGRVALLSRAWTELSGWTAEELPTVEAWIAKGIPPERAADARQRLAAQYAAGGPRDEGEVVIRTRDGRERTWAFATAPLGVQEGVRVVVSMANDVTDRKRAEDALREAGRRKDEFLATLSHELRNPLAPIRNGLYVLDRAAPGSEAARRARAALDRQVRHLTRLVDDLLDVTRISRGKVQLRRVSVNLGQAIEDVTEDLRAQFAAAGIDLHVTLPVRRLWVNGDPARLAQIAGNLLHNAIKFTPAGGRVDVVLEEAPGGHGALLRVRDTGAGIDPALRERIFEPFVQGDVTLARTHGGLGLGLALVRALAEHHGGSAEATSPGPGAGAEFVVRLPLEAEPVRAVAASRDPSQPARRILVVEDNVDAAETMGELLRLDGHEVAVALDGEEALQRARELRPEVILCDIGLPGMSGYDVARAVRRDEALRGALLVALTGYALPDDRRRGVEAGFDEHVAKPLTRERLQELLARAAARADAREEDAGPEPRRGGGEG